MNTNGWPREGNPNGCNFDAPQERWQNGAGRLALEREAQARESVALLDAKEPVDDRDPYDPRAWPLGSPQRYKPLQRIARKNPSPYRMRWR